MSPFGALRLRALPALVALLPALAGCKSATTPGSSRPSFTKGANQIVWHGAGPQTVKNWATNISGGPASGSGGTLAFTVTSSDSALFSVQPAISPEGTLTFTPDTAADGTDTVSITLSTASGNAGGSATRTFTIAVGPVAYVTNQGDGTVSVVNVASGTVTDTIFIGAQPAGVTFTPDGKTAYVADEVGNSVSVVDVASGAVRSHITIRAHSILGPQPGAVAFTPDGKTAYVTHTFDSTVSVIDVPTGTVTGEIPIGSKTTDVAVAPDGKTAYVTDQGTGVSVIDLASGTVRSTIPVASLPYDIALTPDGRTAYVTTYANAGVAVIDVATETVTSTIPVKPTGLVTLLGYNPEGVAFTPDGKTAYVVDNVPNYVAGYVGVIDVASGTVTSTIPVGPQPEGVAFTPDGRTAYVTENGGNEVSVIDVASGRVTGTIAVGTSPVGVAIH